MAETIRLSLIGRGKWGRNYIDTIQSGDVEASLPSENILGRDYREHLDSLRTDGVIVATPTSTHFAVVKDLLAFGLTNILVEKPVTQTLAEAKELETLSKRLGTLILVGHIQLYDTAYREMKNNLGLVGQVRSISFEGLRSNLRTGTSNLQEWGPHPIYLSLDVMEKLPDGVSAIYTSGENVELKLYFGDTVSVSNIGWDYPEKRRNFSITGADGSVTLDWGGSEKTLIFVDPDGEYQKLEFPGQPSPLALEITELVRCINGLDSPRSPLSQGVAVMEIIDLAEKSLKLGGKRINC